MRAIADKGPRKADGYAVAEFAVTLPALISICASCVWIIGLGITKFQLENIVSTAARVVARGEQLDEKFIELAPTGTSIEVFTNSDRIRVEAKLIKPIPFTTRHLELHSAVESILEAYVFQE
jgi:hypothetical protein